MGNPPPKPPFPPPAPEPLIAALRELAATLGTRNPMSGPAADLADRVPAMDPHEARNAAIRIMSATYGLVGGNAPTWPAQRALGKIRRLCLPA